MSSGGTGGSSPFPRKSPAHAGHGTGRRPGWWGFHRFWAGNLLDLPPIKSTKARRASAPARLLGGLALVVAGGALLAGQGSDRVHDPVRDLTARGQRVVRAGLIEVQRL